MSQTSVQILSLGLAGGLGISSPAGAHLHIRVKISSEAPWDEAALLAMVKEQLKQKGILTHGDLTTQPHAENNAVDLVCFDCVLVDGLEAGASTPPNFDRAGH